MIARAALGSALLAGSLLLWPRIGASESAPEPAPDVAPEPAAEPALAPHDPVPRGDAGHGGVSLDHWVAWARNHLDVGTRSTWFALDDGSGTVIGTINRLDEKNSAVPTKVFADVWFNRYVGVQVTWDEVRAETTTAEDGHSDGDFVAGGPIAAVVGRWTNRTRLTPYAGLGYAWFGGEFDAEPWWELTYPSYDEWVAMGRPGTPRNSRRREITVSDPAGPVYLVGVDVKVSGHWSVDVFFRHAELDMDGSYRITQNGTTIDDRGTFNVPLSHNAYGAGVRYSF